MRQMAVLTGVVLACSSAFAADPQLLNLVMPDAKILAGVNATSARISPLGQFILSKIGVNGPELQQFVATTGFNPLQDVSEVLAASAASGTTPGGLVLARGNFPVDKLAATVNGVTVQNYGGAKLIVIPNHDGKGQAITETEKVPQAVAFLGTTIVVAGDLNSVKAAIDRNSHANSIDPALAVKVSQLSASQDEWLVSAAPVASLIPANANVDAAKGPAAQVLPLLKNIQSFAGGLKFTDNVVLTGEAITNDPKNATSLDAVIKLGVLILTSNAPKDVHLAQAVQLLQALQVTANGTAVDLSLSIPEAQIEGLVNSATHGPAKVAAIGHTRSGEFHNGN